jgi:hypothetical protein
MTNNLVKREACFKDGKLELTVWPMFSPDTPVTRTLDVTPAQWLEWCTGVVIQKAMPHLSADDREFIMTGIGPSEWDEMFGENAATAEEEDPA